MRWVSVYSGPAWQVLIYQGRLEAEGLTTFVADDAMGTAIPSPGLFQSKLQVPSSEMDAAYEILAQLEEEAPPPPSPYFDKVFGEVANEEDDEDALPAASTRTDRLSRWTIGLGLFGITGPLALATGFLYLRAARKEQRQASHHNLAIAAMVFGAVTSVGISLAILGRR